jgi:methylated-DNA-[protein]-cysteine S-methyltransferase
MDGSELSKAARIATQTRRVIAMISMVKPLNNVVAERTRRDAKSQDTSIIAFDTELAWMAIAWRQDVLRGTAFGYSSQRQAELALARVLRLPHQFCHFVGEGQPGLMPPWVGELCDDLRRFAEGDPVDFSAVRLELDHLTPFGRRVVAACRRIRWGKVRSYGELAAQCGSPGAARAVGTVMAKNRFPLVVPCHRVLASGGALGGYSAPDGLQMKRRLLTMEGRLTPC